MSGPGQYPGHDPFQPPQQSGSQQPPQPSYSPPPMAPLAPPSDGYQLTQELLPEIDVAEPGNQPRLTVAFRLLILIPHFIVLIGLGIASFVIAIISWFGALFTAYTPEFARRFQTEYLNWFARVQAYLLFLSDSYPPFAWETGGPVVVHIPPPVRMNRFAIFFRFILMIPVQILNTVLSFGVGILAFFVWLTVLVQGRTPATVFGANSAYLRFAVRYQAYVLMLTSAYPKGVFGDQPAPSGQLASPTRPLVLTQAAKNLFVAYIALGVIGYIAYVFTMS